MFQSSEAFSSFSVHDIKAAQNFYGTVLGLTLSDESEMGGGMFELTLATGGSVMIYHKDNHEPAAYTVLHFPVSDIDSAADELVSKGVTFERYEHMPHDAKGIVRGGGERGPDIAWFKDPSGNILGVMARV